MLFGNSNWAQTCSNGGSGAVCGSNSGLWAGFSSDRNRHVCHCMISNMCIQTASTMYSYSIVPLHPMMSK